MEFLRVEEVGEKADSGSTEPYFCRLSDDNLYVTKGRAALSRGLVAEVVCAELGRGLGLPIPESAIATINPNLLTVSDGAKFSLGVGPLFGSKFRRNLDQVNKESISNIDAELLRRVFAFDYWIMNGDRTGSVYGGNSNLFVDVVSKDLVVLDHNLAFDHNFDMDEFVKYHICRDHWFGNPLREALKVSLLDEMNSCFEKMDSIEDIIPYEWIGDEPDTMKTIKSVLARKAEIDFWGKL